MAEGCGGAKMLSWWPSGKQNRGTVSERKGSRSSHRPPRSHLHDQPRHAYKCAPPIPRVNPKAIQLGTVKLNCHRQPSCKRQLEKKWMLLLRNVVFVTLVFRKCRHCWSELKIPLGSRAEGVDWERMWKDFLARWKFCVSFFSLYFMKNKIHKKFRE